MSKNYVVMDGNEAAAYSSYAFTEVAGIYPITPSSPMAEKTDEWAVMGKKNLFGNTVDVVQMQSEAGAAGTCHGSLQAGALTTSYTSSQGLMLMIPGMYAIAGQFLPNVLHIASRTVTTNHHSIFGDHSDIMTCRSTGYAMLMSSSPQEAMDLAAVAHLSAISARYAFIHSFDGFRTSHEMQRIEALDYADLKDLLDWDALKEYRKQALNPEHPTNRGNNTNPDVYFQCKEGANEKIAEVPNKVEYYMNKINELTGRNYKLFNYYGAEDAEEVIVVMCSASETVKETVDYLNSNGRKVGMVQVHLYRPFSVKHFSLSVPGTCKRIAVLDRSKENGSVGEPLFVDVCTALMKEGRKDIDIIGGRYGLSSKDTTPGQIIAVYDNLKSKNPKENFTIGIDDDVSFTSLEYKKIEIKKDGQVACKFWGLGGDGTVGANKNAITTIGLAAGKFAQAYFSYDSMKSGGLTQSHLRFGNKEILSTYLVDSADFIAVHEQAYVNRYDTSTDLKVGGTYLLKTSWKKEELENQLPAELKRDLHAKKVKFYIIDADKVAKEIGLGKRTNNILQAAFFALTNIIPIEEAIDDMKKNNYKSYFKKGGERIVELNNKAVDAGINSIENIEIPESWADATDEPTPEVDATDFVKDIVFPMIRQEGDKLPVSIFKKHGVIDGTWESGTSLYSKRGIATEVPKWNKENCIQCNRCVAVCPHAALRPVLLTAEEKEKISPTFETIKAKGLGKDAPEYQYRLQVSPNDCLSCEVCLKACPAKEALEMKPFQEMKVEQENFDKIAMNEKYLKADVISDKSIKSLQFSKPYFQFSAACGGCAQTTYIKMLSQLVGDHMYAGNAAGCSSAYSGGAPILPYCRDERGYGPAWEHSLFEDNAEFAYGFFKAQKAIRTEVINKLHEMLSKAEEVAHYNDLKEHIENYLDNWENKNESRRVTDSLIEKLNSIPCTEDVEFILDRKEYLAKKSVWAIGGDGWAYDIGFGGIDHVMSQNENVNLLVLDTEVYSNTGGQSSKATPTSSIAKFAAGGKAIGKKDMGSMIMNYGYVYVAQVAIGYDQAQTLKAIKEAEEYPGPSIVICYCPCLVHGLKGGMATTQEEMKLAVESGYWNLYRYDPRRADEGKNPFQLDSPEPKFELLKNYLMSEQRYSSLANNLPERAENLYNKNIKESISRYERYKKMAEM